MGLLSSLLKYTYPFPLPVGDCVVIMMEGGFRLLRVETEFIEAAVVGGCSTLRILSLHILPNVVNSIIVLATLDLGRVIIFESAFSFLGLGVQPPTTSWGSMLADGRIYLTYAWWLATFPGLAIMFTVLGTNLLGDWLRDILDPKRKRYFIG